MKKITIIVLGFLILGCDSRDQVYEGDPYKVLEKGAWDWDALKGQNFCESGSHVIRFSDDKSRMVLEFYDADSNFLSSHKYIIEDSKKGVLHTRLIGEERRDDQGSLVKWKLIVNNESQYCWRRSDWGNSGCSTAVKKCI